MIRSLPRMDGIEIAKFIKTSPIPSHHFIGSCFKLYFFAYWHSYTLLRFTARISFNKQSSNCICLVKNPKFAHFLENLLNGNAIVKRETHSGYGWNIKCLILAIEKCFVFLRFFFYSLNWSDVIGFTYIV